MKLIRKFGIACLSLVWALCGVSCNKDPNPDCVNGDCCWPGKTQKFLKRVDSVRVDYWAGGIQFRELISTIRGNSTYRAFVCPTDSVIKKTLIDNITFDEKSHPKLVDSSRVYPYVLWGNIYTLPSEGEVDGIPYYTIHIERTKEFK